MAAPARPVPWLLLVLPVAILLWGIWQFHGFVQDDAFISLRYSANLARGEGLVFNPGERVEGFTNMAWTLLGGLCLKLGLPALGIWQALGILAALGTVALAFVITHALAGVLPALGAAVVLAGCTTLHAWSGSGLETSFFTFLVVGAFRAEQQGRSRLAFGLLGLAQWTRPEALLVAAALGYVKLRVAHARGHLDGPRLLGLGREFACYALPAVALLLLRAGYYGSLVPNTYLVKGSGAAANHLLGLRKLEGLATFDGFGLVWLLLLLEILPPVKRRGAGAAPPWAAWGLMLTGAAAFFLVDVYLNTGGFWRPDWSLGRALAEGDWDGRWTAVSAILGGLGCYAVVGFPARSSERPVVAWMALVWLGYLYYYVRVGGDLLPMHRIFLPAVPLQCMLAALGSVRLGAPEGPAALVLARDADEVERAEVRGAAFGLCLVGALVVVVLSLQETAGQGHYRTVRDALDRCHGQAGRDLQAIAAAHGTHPSALAQDMGALPLEAMDVVFLDTIGLTDRPVAEILWKYRYSPYFRYLIWEDPEARRRFDAMEEELRQHLTARRPDYAVVNVHLQNDDTEDARRAARELDGRYFLPFMRDNSFFYKWTDTPDFKRDYVLMRAYEYSPVHFLVTYRRREAPGVPLTGAGGAPAP